MGRVLYTLRGSIPVRVTFPGDNYGIVFSQIFQISLVKKKAIATNNKKDQRKITGIKPSVKEDMDDLVHSSEDNISSGQDTEDPDDRVHRLKGSGQLHADEINDMEDPDDLVHGYPDEEDDR